jgi:hypothetical protein
MPLVWMPLVAVLAGGVSTAKLEPRTIARPAVASLGALAGGGRRVAPAAKASDDGGPPPCVADVCQPRVAVPGYEPRLSARGKRTELAAHLLDRAGLEPLASISHFLVTTGLRFDYTPGALERDTLSKGAGGWGHVQVTLRWRVDPLLKPVRRAVR